jgi:hypothetical protein
MVVEGKVRSPVGEHGRRKREGLAGMRCTTPLSLVDLRRSSARPARRAGTRRPPVCQCREKTKHKKQKTIPKRKEEKYRARRRFVLILAPLRRLWALARPR